MRTYCTKQSYTGLISMDDSTAYLVYTDFRHPNSEGTPVKTIMGRRICTEVI